MSNINSRLNSNLVEPNDVLKIPDITIPATTGLETDKKYSLAHVNGNFVFLEMSELSKTDILEGKITSNLEKVTLDASTGNIFYWLVTKNSTIEVINIPNLIFNQSYILVLRMVNAGNFVITWPENFKWVGGTIPSFSTTSTDEVCVMFYPDGNVTVNFALGIK